MILQGLHNEAYDGALATLHAAVAAFAAGDIAQGEQLVADLDVIAIEGDRACLRAIARAARVTKGSGTHKRPRRSPSPSVKAAVARRDHYICRYTGRRLVDTRVFRELGRVSAVFHFDEHHSVRPTKRGPGGHPIVRTHGAAYEHVHPHSHGGEPTTDNLILTSVQLNEAKSTKTLEILDVMETPWHGLSDYLPSLARQRSAAVTCVSGTSLIRPMRIEPALPARPHTQGRRISEHYHRMATAAGCTVYACATDATSEPAFLRLRTADKNGHFVTQRTDGSWMTHRLYCSSLDFTVPRLLTASPKICAPDIEALHQWANRVGVGTTACRRCLLAK
jgi:5-methylcytosine-specific restriction endonuclease McrA